MLSRNLRKKSSAIVRRCHSKTRIRFNDRPFASLSTDSTDVDESISKSKQTSQCSVTSSLPPSNVVAFKHLRSVGLQSYAMELSSTSRTPYHLAPTSAPTALHLNRHLSSSGIGSGGNLSVDDGPSENFLLAMHNARQCIHPMNGIVSFKNVNYQRTTNTTLRAFSTSPQPMKSDEDNTNEKKRKEVSSMSTNSTISSAVGQSAKKSTPSALHRTKHTEKEQSIAVRSQEMVKSAISSLVSMLLKTPGILWFYMTHPTEFRDKLKELKDHAKKEIHHYYMGSKLLMADLRTARSMLKRTLQGTPLSRRERKQLLRTVTDVFRLVPMSVFVLIPFMEFALPFALKIFPNMLPSTFQDSLKAEENMKRELKSRIAMAEFFQETLHDLAKEQKKAATRQKDAIKESDDPTLDLESTENREETASSFLEFIDKARKGEMFPPEVIIRYSTFFKDDLTLDNMPRMQLINMCRYMSIPPYGNDNLLRFQLRHKIRVLQEDDQRILWEGIDSLTKMELREACQERGMRSTGLSKDAYKDALQQWINLSVNRNVPISLLIMSRTFFLHEEIKSRSVSDKDGSKSVAGLADAISGLDKEVVNEVILDAVEEKSDPALMQLKLDVLAQQNDLIEEEKLAREAEEAKRIEKEKMMKEKAESEKVKSEELVSSEGENDVDSAPPSQIETESLPFGNDIDAKKKEATTSILATKDLKSDSIVEDVEPKDEASPEEEATLSSEEIDAISQLVSPDPVSVEREKLEKLKAAMQKETEEQTETEEMKIVSDEVEEETVAVESSGSPSVSSEKMESNEEILASETIKAMDKKVTDEAESSTKFSSDDKELSVVEEDLEEEKTYSDVKLDKTVSRLQAKVESMVGKLEIQLSDIEGKIGDKMHILDKDMDGILSREEMALCLQSVLKRPLSVEEAMTIAADMDQDEDGYFSVEELSNWLEKHKIVKLVEEGRDAEVDRIIAAQSEKSKDVEET